MQTKDTDLQLINQFSGFMQTQLMVDHIQHTSVSAFEFESLPSPQPIQAFPFDHARKFNFLGKRAEIFFLHYLQSSNRYQDINYSKQVIDEKNTLGEFDFICKDVEKDQWQHIELVCKIYLYDSRLDENPDLCWIGPNRKDKFTEKLQKLKSHQFPLLYHPKAESLFEELDLNPWKLKQKLCFKALLFIPEHCQTRFYTTNLEAIAGYYYTIEQFLKKHWKHQLFYMPKKLDWLTDETKNTTWLSYDKIIKLMERFMSEKQSIMLFRKDEKGNNFKCFVVWW